MLMASVVLRGKSAMCVFGSPPTKRTMMSRASSYRALVSCERMPAPRCTLAYQGRNSCTARLTTTDAELVAAVSRSTYCRGPPSSTDTHKSSPTYWPAVNDGVISMPGSSNTWPRNLSDLSRRTPVHPVEGRHAPGMTQDREAPVRKQPHDHACPARRGAAPRTPRLPAPPPPLLGHGHLHGGPRPGRRLDLPAVRRAARRPRRVRGAAGVPVRLSRRRLHG